MIERILQIIATSCFSIMGIMNVVAHSWKFAGINIALFVLYIFLYFVK